MVKHDAMQPSTDKAAAMQKMCMLLNSAAQCQFQIHSCSMLTATFSCTACATASLVGGGSAPGIGNSSLASLLTPMKLPLRPSGLRSANCFKSPGIADCTQIVHGKAERLYCCIQPINHRTVCCTQEPLACLHDCTRIMQDVRVNSRQTVGLIRLTKA